MLQSRGADDCWVGGECPAAFARRRDGKEGKRGWSPQRKGEREGESARRCAASLGLVVGSRLFHSSREALRILSAALSGGPRRGRSPPLPRGAPVPFPLRFVLKLNLSHPCWPGPQGQGEDEEGFHVLLWNESRLPPREVGPRSPAEVWNAEPRLWSVHWFV